MLKIFIYIFFIYFLLFTSCVSSKKENKKAQLHNKLALSLMQKCRYPTALSELRKAIKLQFDEPYFHYSIALLYFQFQKYDKTIEHLKIALKLKPNFTDAKVYLGQTLIEINQLDKGLTVLRKAKKDLTYRYIENIHINIGKAYYKKKQFTLAEKNFSVVRKIRSQNCSIALYHAKSFYFLGQYQKALNLLKSAKKWCKKNVPKCSTPSFEAYFFTALILKNRGQKQKAILNLQIFLDNTKDNINLKKYVILAKKNIKLWKQKDLK